MLHGRPWPDWAIAERYIDERSEVLRHFQSAAKVGGAARIGTYIDRSNLKRSFNTFKPYYDGRELMRLAFLVESRRGRTAEALQALRSRIALDHALQPWHQIGIDPFGHDDPQRSALELVSQLHPSDEDLAELQMLLRRIDYGRRLHQSMMTSRVLAIRSFENGALDAVVEVHRYGLPTRGPSISAIGVSGPADMHAYLDVMVEFVAASKLPWPQALRKAEFLEAQRLRSQALSKPWAAIAVHRTHNYFFETAISEARNRATDVALAVVRYRRKHAETPAELGMMVPEFLTAVPEDPFTGEPLRFRVEKDGFVVYSVGRDRLDGGGPKELYDPGMIFDPSADPGVRMRDQAPSKRKGSQDP